MLWWPLGLTHTTQRATLTYAITRAHSHAPRWAQARRWCAPWTAHITRSWRAWPHALQGSLAVPSHGAQSRSRTSRRGFPHTGVWHRTQHCDKRVGEQVRSRVSAIAALTTGRTPLTQHSSTCAPTYPQRQANPRERSLVRHTGQRSRFFFFLCFLRNTRVRVTDGATPAGASAAAAAPAPAPAAAPAPAGVTAAPATASTAAVATSLA